MEHEHDNFTTLSAREKLEHNYTLLGIFGLMDPLRPGIAEAVAECQKAGINVRMVTGDNMYTAIAIAKQAGIVTEEELRTNNEDGMLCMTGS